MSEANKALVRRWFEEVWNQGREESIDELFDAPLDSLGALTISGHVALLSL